MANGPTLPPQAYTREVLAVAFQWLQGQPESIKKLAQSPDALVGLYLRAQRYGNASPEADAPVSSQNFISDLKNLAEGLKQFESPQTDLLGGGRMEARSANAGMSVTSTRTASMNMFNSQAATRSSPSPSPATPTSTSTSTSTTSSMNFHGQMPEGTQSWAPSAHPAAGQTPAAGAAFDPSQLQPRSFMPPTPPVPPMPSAPVFQQHQHQQQTYHQAPHAPPQPPSQPPMTRPSYESMLPSTQVSLAGHLNPSAQAMIQEVKGHLNLTSDAEVLNMLVAIAYKNIRNLLG